MQTWDQTTLLIKAQPTAGTDAVPTAAANAVVARNVKLNPMQAGEWERELELPWMGANKSIPVGLYATLTFETDLISTGSPLGTAPPIGILFRAGVCGQTIVATTSVAYNPISPSPATQEMVSVYLHRRGRRYALLDAKATAKIVLSAQGTLVVQWTLTGLYVDPSDVAHPTPTLGTQLSREPQPANSQNTPTFTINGVAVGVRSFELDLGNQVAPRFLINREGVIVTGREPRVRMTIEAPALSALNPFALARARTTVPVQLVHGTGAGNVNTLAMPGVQIMPPSSSDMMQGLEEWPLEGRPIPSAGNDEWTLTLT